MRVNVIVPANETQEGGTTAAAASPTKGTHPLPPPVPPKAPTYRHRQSTTTASPTKGTRLPPPPVPPRAPRRVTLPPPPPPAPPKAPTATTSPQKSTQEGGTTTTASPLSGPIWILYYVQEVGIWKNVFLMLKRFEIYLKTKSKVLRGLRKSSESNGLYAMFTMWNLKGWMAYQNVKKTDDHCVQKTLQVFNNFVM